MNSVKWKSRKVAIVGAGDVGATFAFSLAQSGLADEIALIDYCGVGVHNVHAYILGEHGDSEFAAWSLTNIGGIPVDAFCMENGTKEKWSEEKTRIEEQVRRSAYHVIDYKGSTYFAVGLALVRIIGAILRNQSSVLTISTLLQGEYGQDGVCISVPCLIDGDGVKRIIKAELPEVEAEALSRSAEVLRKAYGKLA